ncbi:MAG: universal stress protein [Bacteroidota bacterium]
MARHVDCDVLFLPEGNSGVVKHVLVAMDFSKNADRALQQALAIAAASGAKVECVHVYNGQPSVFPKLQAAPLYKKVNQVPEAIQSEYELFQTLHQPDPAKVSFSFLDSSSDNISKVLKAYAKYTEADILFIGARGHNLAERFLFGSVAEGMVSGAWLPTAIYIVR